MIQGPVTCAAVNHTPGDHREVDVRSDLNHRLRGVRDVRERRAVDRQILRRPIEVRREGRAVVERDRRRLRNRIGDRRLLRLRRTRHGRQHRARGRLRRDVRKVRRQRVARHESPGAGEGGGIEPAARDQHVVVVVADVDQHIARRVRCPQQLRAHDRLEVRLALEHDQLGRHLARVYRRHAVRERGLRVGLGAAIEHVDGAGIGEASARRRRCRAAG